MADSGLKGGYYQPDKGGEIVYFIFNELSGFYLRFVQANQPIDINGMAREWETNSWVKMGEFQANALFKSLDAVRSGK